MSPLDVLSLMRCYSVLSLMLFSPNTLMYLTDDPKPFISGTRINSPHYLCKINPSSENASKYTLVVSQVCDENK